MHTTLEPVQGTDEPLDVIGEEGGTILALALAGGGINTVFQLGVAHALLVIRGRAPDLIAGISSGAIHATAIAEIMKAGSGVQDDQERLQKQFERFHFYLDECLSAPAQLTSMLLPDAYQVQSGTPLEPLRLASQTPLERRHREEGVGSSVQLINLLNEIIDLPVSLGDATRVTRAYLGFKAAGEAPTPWMRHIRESAALWQLTWIGLRNLVPLASLMRPILATLPDVVRRRFIGPASGGGQSVAHIIFRFEPVHQVIRGLQYVAAVLVNAFLWLVLVGFALFKAFQAVVDYAIEEIRRTWAWIRRKEFHQLLGPGPGPSSSRTFFEKLIRFGTHEILAARRLNDCLLEPEVLRQWFIRLFDEHYYGRLDASSFDVVVGRGLARNRSPIHLERSPKLISDYSQKPTAIRLGIAAANLKSGDLEMVPKGTPVVEALMAATAALPAFRAQSTHTDAKGDAVWYVDGMNIANEPTQAVVNWLQDHAHPKAKSAYIFPVNFLTFTKKRLEGDPKATYPTWFEVARRALNLKKYRDASLEWRLTDLHNRLLPPGKVVHEVPVKDGKKPKRFVRAIIVPIEPEKVVNLGKDYVGAETEEKRREVMLRTIARGCEATLSAILPGAIEAARQRAAGTTKPTSISCSDLVKARLGHDSQVPNTNAKYGPGLSAICLECALLTRPGQNPDDIKEPGHVRWQDKSSTAPAPDWPDGRPGTSSQCSAEPESPPSQDAPRSPMKAITELFANWPRSLKHQTGPVTGRQKPLVNLLFSGGVFRGVYQVGVVNALNEVGLEPDLIAGSSVGSMTAVMVADLFSRNAQNGDRSRQMARFAEVFLDLDRLVLTDRFANAVRTFTLRAAQSGFSPRDVDHVLRRFDEARSGPFNQRLRNVLAGVERLFYVSPFAFIELVEAVRAGKNTVVLNRLEHHLHRFLQRDKADKEILGAEPLNRIIRTYVLEGRGAPGSDPADVPFGTYLDSGIHFISTATNLTQGSLKVFGDVFPREGEDSSSSLFDIRRASLLEAVLASSAFPAIFRPRIDWEIMRGAGTDDLLIDGGTMDNLPLDAVTSFIHEAANNGFLTRRPTVGGTAVPHLLLSASLEVDPPKLRPRELNDVADDWPQCSERAKQLGYNRKVESYRSTQQHLRLLHDWNVSQQSSINFVPVDFEVVSIKPSWLCSTFAFHPMLGFRRQRQAESIAHGCATTLVKLQDLAQSQDCGPWVAAWGIDPQLNQPRVGRYGLRPDKVNVESGDCVFRAGQAKCPFSRKRLEAVGLKGRVVTELECIYVACGRPETHLATKTPD